ncbi:MAG: hypothetical protein LC660_15460 [Desulfobacteraceae bacterium]|nr:hypothetical protein [Desulfobacteraceae bacterium]
MVPFISILDEQQRRLLLDELNFSLKANNKALSAGSHPDRDKQFSIIKHLRETFSATGDPIISVDTKSGQKPSLCKTCSLVNL